jgi:hypothetical protein
LAEVGAVSARRPDGALFRRFPRDAPEVRCGSSANTAFEQRASLKARGYRWDDGEGKRVKAWWLMTNNPQTELGWLRADIYGDDRHVTVLKAPATRRYSSRLWAG